MTTPCPFLGTLRLKALPFGTIADNFQWWGGSTRPSPSLYAVRTGTYFDGGLNKWTGYKAYILDAQNGITKVNAGDTNPANVGLGTSPITWDAVNSKLRLGFCLTEVNPVSSAAISSITQAITLNGGTVNVPFTPSPNLFTVDASIGSGWETGIGNNLPVFDADGNGGFWIYWHKGNSTPEYMFWGNNSNVSVRVPALPTLASPSWDPAGTPNQFQLGVGLSVGGSVNVVNTGTDAAVSGLFNQLNPGWVSPRVTVAMDFASPDGVFDMNAALNTQATAQVMQVNQFGWIYLNPNFQTFGTEDFNGWGVLILKDFSGYYLINIKQSPALLPSWNEAGQPSMKLDRFGVGYFNMPGAPEKIYYTGVDIFSTPVTRRVPTFLPVIPTPHNPGILK